MMICPTCFHVGLATDVFCPHDGQKLLLAQCSCIYKALYQAGDKHCRKCGREVPAVIQRALSQEVQHAKS